MKICCCIISWFGHKEVRDKRKEFHEKQLDWVLSIPEIEEIFILAQEYEETEFRTSENPRIKYIRRPQTNQGQARNILLDQFYNSDYDWVLFLDNDAILYDHMSSKSFFKEFKKIETAEQLSFIDCIVPIDPRQEPFTAEYQNNKSTVDNNLVFKSWCGLKTSFWVFRNIKKYYDLELYFDKRMKMMEDHELAIQLIYSGFGVYKSKNMVLKEFGSNTPTLNYEIGRKEVNDIWMKEIYSIWKKSGMQCDENGKAIANKFMKKHYKQPKELVIPKSGDDSGLLNFME